MSGFLGGGGGGGGGGACLGIQLYKISLPIEIIGMVGIVGLPLLLLLFILSKRL